MAIPPQLVNLLRQHRAEQEAERVRAGALWHEEGWVFATETGRQLNYQTDWNQWKRLLRSANVRDGRLHDARHTAATVLLVLGVPERIVMEIMGWSTGSMTRRYQHVTDSVKTSVATKVGDYFWTPNADNGTGTDSYEQA